jgi:hypothetical protein
MRPKATSFDDSLDGVSAEQRAALERLRRTIRAAAPRVKVVKLRIAENADEGRR